MTIQQCSTPVTEGDNATLYCNATGNPVPNITWIKGGEVLLSHTEMLAIAKISRSESGSYECLAWNGIGKNGSKSCTIDVHCKSSFIIFYGLQVSKNKYESNLFTSLCKLLSTTTQFFMFKLCLSSQFVQKLPNLTVTDGT